MARATNHAGGGPSIREPTRIASARARSRPSAMRGSSAPKARANGASAKSAGVGAPCGETRMRLRRGCLDEAIQPLAVS